MLLTVENLTKSFGNRKTVDSVSFAVEKGEVFGLLGPNGAGKSTIISMICGLTSPDSGNITVLGETLHSNPSLFKSYIALVPQDIALYPTLSAKDNLLFWGRMYGIKGDELRSRVQEALEIAALTGRAGEHIENFSGGMKRRINIAASLLHKPKLLIMDEPTVGIDPQSRSHILETVKFLNEQGTSVIYTSHYMEEVEALCSRIAVIDKGKILASGTIKELLQAAGDHEVITIEAATIDERLVNTIKALSDVSSVTSDEKHVQFSSENGSVNLLQIFNSIDKTGLKISGFKVKKPNLENVFLQLTGRTLRD